jgi:pilus assembly protein CpaC
VPEQPPRPPEGPESVPSFVESLSHNDAGFEVVVGQGRILTLKEDLGKGKTEGVIAVGDPTVIDFVPLSPRKIRILGLRLGVTDLSVTTAERAYNFEVRVVMDLDVLRAQLRCLFPDAHLKLGQIRDQVAVEGEARDTAQVARIINTVQAYVNSVTVSQGRRVSGTAGRPAGVGPGAEPLPLPRAEPGPAPVLPPAAGFVTPAGGVGSSTQATVNPVGVLNLIRVPGAHQVLLKVRVAELNRSALRQLGTDLLGQIHGSGATLGTQIGGSTVSSVGTISQRTLKAVASIANSPSTTAFGIFEAGHFEIFLSALRRNNVLKVLAEPNLVALNGHQATFLAGGEFPVPVPQFGGAGGAAATVTVQFQQFGVQLGFVPTILDGEVIRLSVTPEVSEIDFTVATTLVPGGSPVPGLSTRKTHTTVEMQQGQTLMIAGLLQLTVNGSTARVPGLGDLPVVGQLFSNTSSARQEKELVVLVTPYLIEPMNPDQVPPAPGDEVNEPNDLELYLLGRIESRTGKDFRSTNAWSDPYHFRDLLHLQSKYLCGPFGFTD